MVNTRNRGLILGVLGDGLPRSIREISVASGLSLRNVGNTMFLGWKAGLVLRSEKPSYEVEVVNLGRRGRSSHTRPFHRYLFAGEGLDSVTVEGRRFVKYAREYLDARGGGPGSKSGLVFKFLRENKDNAFYTTQIAKSLAEQSVRLDDVMANARRWEKKGLVYIRGYKTDGGQSPFREGYMLTWVDPKKPREQAMSDAVARTDKALEGVYASSPTMTRINRIRDMVVEHTQLRSLVGFTYLEDQLRCSHDQARARGPAIYFTGGTSSTTISGMRAARVQYMN